MMTPKKLFVRRLWNEMKFQFRAIGMVVDWIIALYLVIPAVIAGVAVYVNWWRDIPPWIAAVPFWIPAVFLFIFLSFGEIRLYVKEADIVFLRQTGWLDDVMRSGMVYSFLRDVIWTAAVIGVVLPFLLLRYHFSYAEIAVLSVFSLAVREVLLYAENILSLKFSGLLKKCIDILVFVVFAVCYVRSVHSFATNPMMLAVFTLLLGAILYVLIRMRKHREGSFFADVEREQEQRMKLASFLMMQKAPREKKSIFSRRRPYVFSRSQKLFKRTTPANGLAAVHLKIFLRSKQMWFFYIQFTVLASAGILLAPLWIKWLIWVAVLPLFAGWFKGYVKSNEKHSFMSLWRWKKEDHRLAARKTWVRLLPVFTMMTGIVLGVSGYSWVGAVLMVPVALLYTYVVTGVMTSWW